MDPSLLRVERLAKSFGGLEALRDVTFTLSAGRIYGLIGPNGAGKTTLFNAITGFSPPTRGAIHFNGNEVTRRKPYEIARLGVARTYQLVRPFNELTVTENVEVGSLFGRPHKWVRKSELADRNNWLTELVGLADKKNHKASELNLIERKRLEIAKALAAEPTLVLFDEVFAGLNPTEADQAFDLFEKIHTMNATIFMIEHNMRVIMKACQHILVLHHGVLIAQGAPSEVAQDPGVIDAYLGKGMHGLSRNRYRLVRGVGGTC